jgi:hypothetical protein
MAFAVDDFHSLVRLLEEHPEWRADLRRLVLTDELLSLPEIVRELAEAQRRTEERLDALTETVAQLAEAQRRTEATLAALITRVDRMDNQLQSARGDLLELRYRFRAGGYFGRLLRRVRVVSDEELDDLLEPAIESGRLSEDEAQHIRLADLVLRGRRRDTGDETYAVLEASIGIGLEDVARARYRAGLLGKIRPAVGVVAGERIIPEAEQIAAPSGVEVLLTHQS